MTSEFNKKTCDRRTFVKNYMAAGGLTYTQACRVYDVMCKTFEEAILNGTKITVGRVGAVVPHWRAPRDVQMHFGTSPGPRGRRESRGTGTPPRHPTWRSTVPG